MMLPEVDSGSRSPRRWWPTLLVGSVVLVLTGVLPALNAFVPYEADLGAGLEPAGFAPPPFPADMPELAGRAAPVQVVSSAVAVTVSSSPVEERGGCPAVQRRAVARVEEDLEVLPRKNTVALTTSDGVSGVRVVLTSPVTEAQVFVVCQDEIAVVATASGPLGWPSEAHEQVERMFRGVEFR